MPCGPPQARPRIFALVSQPTGNPVLSECRPANLWQAATVQSVSSTPATSSILGLPATCTAGELYQGQDPSSMKSVVYSCATPTTASSPGGGPGGKLGGGQQAQGSSFSAGLGLGAAQNQNQTPSQAATQSAATPQQSAGAATVDCFAVQGSSSCSFQRSFQSDDRAWWDFSLSVTIPGYKQATYTITDATSATAPASVATSVTRHTEMYGLFDWFPGAWLPTSRPLNQESAAPHVVIGLPTTGQPFLHPFFGLAENLTSWDSLERHGFPLRLSAFAGLVWTRNQEYVIGNQMAPYNTPQPTLKNGDTWKLMFGVEVSMTTLLSKLGGGKSSTATGATGSPTGSSTASPHGKL